MRLLGILFIINLFSLTVCSDNILRCDDQSLCANGGTCVLSSVLPAIQQCRPDETFYEDSCISLYPNPLVWDTASSFCQGRGGNLIDTQTEDELFFYDQFIQSTNVAIIREQRPDERPPRVWLNVRSISRDGVPEWAEFPQMYAIDQYFWAQGEPNKYANYSEVCVAMALNPATPRWIAANCTEENYTICKRLVTVNKDVYTRQCICTDGFSGQYCEQTDGSEPAQKVSCATEKFEFACQGGAQIVVDFASFGATDGSRCDGTFRPHTCSHPQSLQTIINRCQGLTYCSIADIQSAFPETPCPEADGLNLQTRIRCSQAPQSTCPKDSSYMQGRCYKVTFETKKNKLVTFEEAEKRCNEMMGSLVTDIDSGMNDELVRQLRGKVKKNSGYFWIGAKTCDCKEGTPKWTTGEPLSFVPTNSSINTPSACLAYSISSSEAHWTSIDCDETANFICSSAPTSASEQRVTETYTQPPVDRPTVAPPQKVVQQDAFPNIWCAETKWRGVIFPRVRACMEAKVPCPDPDNIVGIVTWSCDCKSGKWVGQPNSNNCQHKWVLEVTEAMNRGDPADQIVVKISNELTKTIARQLYGGDITGTVNVSSSLVDLASNQLVIIQDRIERMNRSMSFAMNLGEAGDQLMSSKAKVVWSGLDKQNQVKCGSQLMTALQQSSLLMADYLEEETKTMEFQQWAVKVQISKPVESFVATGLRSSVIMDDDQLIQHDDTVEGTQQNANYLRQAKTFRKVGQVGQTLGIHGGRNFVEFSEPVDPPRMSSLSFTNFDNSPTIGMPSLSKLRESAGSSITQSVQSNPTTFTAQAAAAVPTLDRNPLKIAYYIFTALGDLLNSDDAEIINSQIVGTAINDAQRSVALTENVTFRFPHIHTKGVKNARCVYWDLEQSVWSEEGCTLVTSTSQETVCTCSHLTSFAILMDLTGNVGRLTGGSTKALDVVSSIGCAFSVVCLALSLFVFTFFTSLYNVRNTIHRNLCFCLLVGELVFVIGVDRTENATACSVVALLLHYFFLAAFCWMFLEGYQLYMMLIKVFEPGSKRILLYCLFAYGIPVVIVAISAGTTWKDYGTDQYCWLNTARPIIWAFIAPVIIVVAANILFLLMALKVVLSVNGRDRSRMQRVIGWLKGSATLLCLLGVTWIFGFLTAANGATMFFAWMFTILNCTQGIFIFILHVVMNDKVRIAIVRWIRTGMCCGSDTSSAGYNSKSYISSRQRFLNMIRNSNSSPSTDSTDDSKDRVTTPNLNSSDWRLRQLSQNSTDPVSEKGIEYRPSIQGKEDAEPRLAGELQEETASTQSSDPRSSQVLDLNQGLAEEKHRTVLRRKFPLGATNEERASSHGTRVIVERF